MSQEPYVCEAGQNDKIKAIFLHSRSTSFKNPS
jgi:hypothetical protein